MYIYISVLYIYTYLCLHIYINTWTRIIFSITAVRFISEGVISTWRTVRSIYI